MVGPSAGLCVPVIAIDEGGAPRCRTQGKPVEQNFLVVEPFANGSPPVPVVFWMGPTPCMESPLRRSDLVNLDGRAALVIAIEPDRIPGRADRVVEIDKQLAFGACNDARGQRVTHLRPGQ